MQFNKDDLLKLRQLIHDLVHSLSGAVISLDFLICNIDKKREEYFHVWLANEQITRSLEILNEIRSSIDIKRSRRLRVTKNDNIMNINDNMVHKSIIMKDDNKSILKFITYLLLCINAVFLQYFVFKIWFK